MTFESAPNPHLPSLTTLLEDYSTSTGKPLTVFAVITGGQLTELRLSDADGNPLTPAGLMSSVVNAIDHLIASGELPRECELRLHTVATITAAIIEEPTSSTGSPVNNEGLVLRSALLALGHRKGYSSAEIEADTRAHGIYLPELYFYRSLVREGKVAEGPNGDIFASQVGADFGVSLTAGGAKAKIAEVDESDIVLPLYRHDRWIELAHDSQTLYAIDLAPGPAGRQGQIIARSAQDPQRPYPVAASLAQFVTGHWYNSTLETTWQAVTSVLEPSSETTEVFSEIDRAQERAQDSEEEIRDLRDRLETHNSDRLNNTEHSIADDLSSGAFVNSEGDKTGGGRDKKEHESEVKNREGQKNSDTSEAGSIAKSTPPASTVQEKKDEYGFRAAIRKFFMG